MKKFLVATLVLSMSPAALAFGTFSPSKTTKTTTTTTTKTQEVVSDFTVWDDAWCVYVGECESDTYGHEDDDRDPPNTDTPLNRFICAGIANDVNQAWCDAKAASANECPSYNFEPVIIESPGGETVEDALDSLQQADCERREDATTAAYDSAQDLNSAYDTACEGITVAVDIDMHCIQ